MNVDISKLQAGVFGLSHGGGMAGELIRHATGSWAGHAVLYLGSNTILSPEPPRAVLKHADAYPDMIWAWRMWDQLEAEGRSSAQIMTMQQKVVGRGYALVGESYDFSAYIGFALEVLKLRDEQQLEMYFRQDEWRVCSAAVYDAETFGSVPMEFVTEDGPGLVNTPGSMREVQMPPNLVSPGMLLGLAQRLEWT